MKILLAACLFLYLAAVYGQEARNATPVITNFWLQPPGSGRVCQRAPTLWQRVYYSWLYTNTNGVIKYYFQCSFYYVKLTGCRESGKGCPSSYVTYTTNPTTTSSSCQCCKPTYKWTIKPTMYCKYVFTFRCPRWNLQMNVRVRDHPITLPYNYTYVFGCSCQECVGRLPLSPIQVAAERGEESDEEQAAIADINQIPEFKADRETQPNSNPSAQERATAFRLIPSQERSARCRASPEGSRIEA